MKKQTFVIGGDPGAHAKAIERMRDYFRAIDKSKAWKVTIEPYSKRRTNEQNAFMWVWIDEVAKLTCDHTGMDPGEIHEFFKAQFAHPKIITVAGVEVRVQSTKHMTTAQMGEYMDRIHAWAASELGITLPPPRRQGER